MELSLEAGSWWSYALVFLGAAVPVVEILVVVPAGVLAGMSPVPTALVAVAGNLSTVVLVALAGDRILTWWRARRTPRDRGPSEHGTSDGGTDEPGTRDRAARARDLARRWGVPGLAFLAPVTTGTHIATVAALATGSDTRRVLRWMTVGIVGWAIAAAAVTAAGLDVFA